MTDRFEFLYLQSIFERGPVNPIKSGDVTTNGQDPDPIFPKELSEDNRLFPFVNAQMDFLGTILPL